MVLYKCTNEVHEKAPQVVRLTELEPEPRLESDKTMVTFERIKSNLQDVTSEQIGRCHRVIDMQTGEDFYMVESESDPTEEYQVRYSTDHGFTCTCKSGQYGFANVGHPSGTCKHCRWSVAAWLEEEAAKAEMCEKLQHPLEHLAIRSVEASLPEWLKLKNARPASHMKRAPRELN